MISPGESIIINGGTTTWRLAEFLRDADLDILTNSFAIAAELLATSKCRITVPGGTVYRELNTILSPFPSGAISHFWARTMFTGCFGISGFGMMENDPLYVQAGIYLIERAERIVVMADSRKLRQRSPMIVTGIDRVTTLITDFGGNARGNRCVASGRRRYRDCASDGGRSVRRGGLGPKRSNGKDDRRQQPTFVGRSGLVLEKPASVSAPPVLALEQIDKSFPGVHALKNVSFDVRAGEVHALLGENGAGKSSMIKVISGVYQPTRHIRIDGQSVRLATPVEAQRAGIATIYQELLLFPN